MIETGFKFDFLLSFIILFISLIIYGRYVSKNIRLNPIKRKIYWKYSLFPLILYTLIEGLRYGRGRDYLWYKYQYENILSPVVNQEYLFTLISKTFHFIGFPYWTLFMLYAFTWIYCSSFLFSKIPHYAKWGIPLFFLATVGGMESMIRQFFALAFLLPTLYYIPQKKWIPCIILILISISIHTASLITFILFVGVFLIFKSEIKLWISIPLYLFFCYVWDISNIGFIADILSLVNLGGNKLASYTENADLWFSADAVNTEEFARGAFAKFAATCFELSIFILGYLSIKKEKYKNIHAIFFYNLFVIGAISYQAVFTLEILRRIFDPLFIIWGIVVAHIFTKYRLNSKYPLYIKGMQIIIVFYIISYFIIKNRLLIPSQMFIWDIGNYTKII